ncbi:B3 domain-containing protein REM7-like [Brassica napus]|uniref:B3 domain-containing protein REM7-like n=1 Tax=Brassica napus TaxID=3708 RepID=UPI0020785549|nr:B3 domain-containing protein REM7-like [Brassica napus]XP_048592470.1 B3 domain-containing protein REM7-like [Brassica napus]
MLRLSYIFRHYLLYTRKKKRNHFRPNAKKKKSSRRQAISKRLDTKMPNSHKPHFLKPLLPDFHSGVTIPLGFFSQHIEGKTNRKTWKLRSDATDQTWEVIQEGRRLTGGWKDFTTAHDLQIGDIVIFKHEGDMVFHVTPFGPSCCEIQYTHPHIIKEEADADDAPSFSFDYCFQAEVTASNLKEDKLYLPEGATTCTALNKQCQEIILVNKEGNSWTVSLRFSEADGMYYIRRGWRKFCRANRCAIGDLFVFNVVGDGKTTPLMCVCPEREE